MSELPSQLNIPAPAALAAAQEKAMLDKALKPWGQMFLLALSGGAFIALGFVFFVSSQQGLGADFPLGVAKVLGGLVFSVGLMLVVVSGSDLFTGTTMTLMPLLSKSLGTGRWLGHWGVSLAGNLVGSVGVALLILWSGTPESNKGAWGLVVMNTSLAKVTHTWGQAFFLGVFANFAVCLAVWLATSGRSTADKILACLGPVALFVASGFEHSVANMFMLPMGLLIKDFGGDAFWSSEAVVKAGKHVGDYDALTLGSVVGDNLIPVILGNIVGGGILVGGYFWACYIAPARRAAAAQSSGSDGPAAAGAGAAHPGGGPAAR